MGALDDIIQLIPGYDPVATAGDCWFDKGAAQLALDFFPECLRHVKGELGPSAEFPNGQPFILEPEQQAIVANIFGWKRPDGMRRYRVVFILVPRKNGKTTFAAGIVDYVLFCDDEPGAEIYSAAADREQAALVFQQAAGMVRQCPELNSRATIYKKSIVLKNHTASYQPISHEANTKWGFNTHCFIADEVHAHKTRDLIDALETSTGARRQPLEVLITTIDYDHPSICNEKQLYAEQVRDGIINNPSFLPVIHVTARDADWRDEKVWAAANPNLGVSLKLSYLREEFQKAVESPAFENTFKRFHLNMKTEQAVRWLNMERWNACDGAVNAAALVGHTCYAGLDLASTEDIAAFVLFFPDADNAILPFFWLPGDNAHKRERKDRVPYETWARQDLIELTPGNVTDYTFIRRRINEIAKLYDLREIAYDPWNARHFAQQLQDEDGLVVLEFRQGWQTMSEPCKRLEVLIKGGQLRHGGHPVLRWMASNVTVKANPDDNLRFDKAKSSEKIDGMVALTMAVGCAMQHTKRKGSVYETRGLVSA